MKEGGELNNRRARDAKVEEQKVYELFTLAALPRIE